MAVERKHPSAECESCPLKNERAVHSDGPTDATYAVIGEAPGRQEQSKGKPFIGPSGKILDATLADVNIGRREVFVTNTVLCRPPGKDADIPSKAIDCCRPRLQEELSSLSNVKRVLAVGNTAASEMLEYKTRITKDRVGAPRHSNRYNVEVVPTVHPAAILRSADHFPSFVTDVDKLKWGETSWTEPTFLLHDVIMEARRALDSIPTGATVAVDIETSVEKDVAFEHPETIICVGIATSRDRAIVIVERAMRSESVRASLSEVLDRCNVIYHNGKFDVGVFNRQCMIMELENAIYADTMLASYCLDERPGHHSLDELSRDLLGSPDWKYVTKKYDSFDAMPRGELYKYNAYDVVNTLRLWEIIEARLKDEHQTDLHDMLCRISESLIEIEDAGIKIDTYQLGVLDAKFTEQLEKLEESLSTWVDNPRSWQQVTQALSHHFGVETPSTDKEHLTQIYEAAAKRERSELEEFLSLLLEHRKATKLLGTYVRGLKKRLTNDNRIKPNLTLHSSTTGRTSSKNPNLQNIVREHGIRDVFIPDSEDYLFVYADFNNIEGRITAVLAGDENLMRMFSEGRKPHKEVATATFGEDFTNEEYVLAKSVVHGVNYKRTPHGIAEGLNIPLKKAKKTFDMYMKMAPKLPDWHEEIRQHAVVEQKPLVTPFGRKRRFPLITKQNVDDVLREAVAFQPQSIASDLNTLAGIELKKMGWDVRLLVHDAVLVQINKSWADNKAEQIATIMQNSAERNYPFIPFPVEAEIGKSWGDAE